MEKCAVIDIGSNTIRLCAYTYEGENIQTLISKKTTAGLASYVEEGDLTQAGIRAACAALGSCAELLDHLNISNCHAFATASLRNINNTGEVTEQIEKETGFKVEVISGEEEGRLSLRGAAESVNISSGLLADIGGGSTEIVPFENKKALSVSSIKAGSLTLYKKFVEDFLPARKECEKIAGYYDSLLSEISFEKADVICGVGGTFRAVSKLMDSAFKRDEETNAFTYKELCALYKIIRKNDRPARDLLLKVCPDRLHTVTPGMIAVKVIMEKSSCTEVKVSKTGVREGYMFAKILKM